MTNEGGVALSTSVGEWTLAKASEEGYASWWCDCPSSRGLSHGSVPMNVLKSRAWVRYWRPVVLMQEPYCPGYPNGYHKGALVRTTSVDHITPRSKGGPTVRENLRGLCGPCNSRKSVVEEGARSWR